MVSYTVDTFFAGVLGADMSTMKARAVAGFEPVGWPEGAGIAEWDPRYSEGIVTLDPNPLADPLDPNSNPIPGLWVKSPNTQSNVAGSVVVNSAGKGDDQYAQPVNWGNNKAFALSVPGKSKILARYIQVRGGVDNLANCQQYDAGGPEPLFCRGPVAPDPLASLPVPWKDNARDPKGQPLSDRERQAGYFQRIMGAQQAWLANNLGQADRTLDDCPEKLRSWEWLYLKRLCHAELAAWPVQAFPVDSPGRWVVTRPRGREDPSLAVLDALNGKEIYIPNRLPGLVWNAALSPDGRRVAIIFEEKHEGQGKRVAVWDLPTGKEVYTLKGLGSGTLPGGV